MTEQLTLVAGSVRLQSRENTSTPLMAFWVGLEAFHFDDIPHQLVVNDCLFTWMDVPTIGAMACTFCDCPMSLIRSGWDDLQLHLDPQTLFDRYWFSRRLTSSFLELNVPLHGHAFCCYWCTAPSMHIQKGYQLSFLQLGIHPWLYISDTAISQSMSILLQHLVSIAAGWWPNHQVIKT